MSATSNALERGQRRYRTEQQREAVRRVKQFRVWQRHGYDKAHLPAELPTDHDFRIAREARR